MSKTISTPLFTRLFILLTLALGPTLAIAQPTPSQTELDVGHSSIGFSVKHMMVSNVRGNFKKFSAVLNLDAQDVTKSSAEFAIDAASVNTDVEKRDDHLRGPDFFDVAKFPTITFKSTKIKKVGRTLQLTGELTIRDVTKSVTFTVDGPSAPTKDPWGTTKSGFSATAKINRKDFGLTWNKALESGGLLVSDDVTINVEGELNMKKS